MEAKRKISSFSIILIFVCLSLTGLALMPELSVRLSPSQTLPQISIEFSMYGSSPRTVELEATAVLESMLNRISGVQKISSTSGNGWGRIELEFDKHTDMEIARLEASGIIRQTWGSLPENISYPILSQNRVDENADRPFLNFTINAPGSPYEIQQFAENNLKPALSMIDGVSRISITGVRPMVWQITYDAMLMDRYGISIQDVRGAVGHAISQEFLGMASVESIDNQKEWIRIAAYPSTGQDDISLENIGIKQIDGTVIPLEKIASINRVEAKPRNFYRINGLNSIYMSITAEENSNQLVLGNTIKQELDALKSTFPIGYEVHIGYDATEYIKAEMNKIYFRIGLTLIILLLFVSFAYSSFRYTLLIVSSLFANLAVAVIFYYWFRLEIQLYSLAGITISMTLIIDNTIVMADHLIRRSNRLAFTSILAATVTTVGALSVIFFLDERLRLTLQDFAAVVILNLVISLFVALFLVPALMDKIGLLRKQRKFQLTKKKTLNIYFFRFYGLLCQFLYRWKVIVVIMLVLAFGLPVFLLPNKVEGSSVWASLYNKSFGTPYYKEHISLYANQLLGGAWRLFSEKVYTGSYFASREETRLYIRASLPSHATIQEMDALIQHMEGHIGRFIEVRQFRTNIHNGQRATIDIQFAEDYAKTGFPYFLKEYLISRSLELGGGSWRIYGVGDGFSNDLREGAGAYRLELFGFNFDELSGWARKIKDNLEQHRRINEVTIGSEFSWYKNDYEEFIFELDKQRLAEENIQPYQLYEQLKLVFAEDISLGRMVTSAGLEPLYISSKQSKEYNQWGLLHMPVKVNNKEYKVAELAQIKKSQVAQEVGKINQEYRLCLQYEYIGASEPGKRVLENFVKEFQEDLPVGYRVQIPDDYRLDHESYKQYGLLLLIVVIIYFVSSILFNSLKQPLYIISVVPISYIGIFMSFYLFKINFDQGGLASFILLSGLAINANIYIIDEYNHLRKKRKHISRLKAYQKAWGAKAKPIFLTVLSTILGFSPFLIGESKEVFWFPLAVGTIGGLIVSTLATFLFLPLFMGVGKTGDTHP